MVPLDIAHWALFVVALLTACAFDVLKRKVPNWLTVGILFAGIGARLMVGGLPAAAWGLLGSVLGLVVLLYPFHRGFLAGL